jgi:putative addiction module component (TIGR02574 family)
MSQEASQLLESALRLSEKERGELIASLIDSMDAGLVDEGEEALSQELAKRIAEVKTGTVKPIPWDQARKMIVEELGQVSEER